MKKTGAVPPGNAKGNKEWSSRQRAAKPEIRLTPGKGIQDLSVPLSDILQQVVDQNRVRPRCHAGCRRDPLAALQCRHTPSDSLPA